MGTQVSGGDLGGGGTQASGRGPRCPRDPGVRACAGVAVGVQRAAAAPSSHQCGSDAAPAGLGGLEGATGVRRSTHRWCHRLPAAAAAV
ncbi:hypothetical protein AV530_003999 [Patagioenas fasciata monilis]|uniref:Uncharacterized protein n=1 Tax=Patagioenas fasciata monilis TaxID=372326 RepID=A0A1V4K4Z9_PATFA|nr:hypothetical protein AV530_003999 [Patagioenas fasciata monilis]